MKTIFSRTKCAIILSFSLSIAFASTDTAQKILLSNQHHATNTSRTANMPALIPPAPRLSARSYVLMDANTGKILAQKKMSARVAPASLTKIMTLYLTFQAIQSGQIHLDDKVRISRKAWSMGGSRMFLRAGSQVPVNDLVRGVIVASGNDACVALAQYIAGTEATFADLMNQTAARLGMKNTHYVDSTGLPNKNHYSTAEDMAILTRAIIRDFPSAYHFFNEKWITYNHIKQPNRNRLLWRDNSVDGLKTGHTKAAGYCLISSGKRNGMRLISVVMGTPSDSARANNSQALLNYGFRFYKTYKLFDANQAITKPRVWLGEEKFTTLGLKQPLYVTIPATEYKNLKASMSLNGRLTAPIITGDQYGSITLSLRDQKIAEKPLIALQHDPKGGFFSRMTDHIMMFIKG